MYTRIIDPTIELYDAESHELLGIGTFELPRSEENKLLDLVNYGLKPKSLLVLNAYLYNPSANYIPATPDKPLSREGVIKAQFVDTDSKNMNQIEIRIQFDSRPRGITPGDPYNYTSVDFNNITVESVKEKY